MKAIPSRHTTVVRPGLEVGRLRFRDWAFWGAIQHHPRWSLALGAAALLIFIAYAIAALIDEPLRRRMEAELNAQLSGYRVTIGELDFHPLSFALDLDDSIIVQIARPEPPMAFIPELHASVQWRALIFGKLVADFVFERPKLHITLAQAEQEAEDNVPIDERGWQDALYAIYPLKVNAFRVVDGDITYVDRGPFKPLHITSVDFRAGNIRNVRSGAGEYPSDVHLDAIVLQTGRLTADGHADFLAKPHAAFKTDVDLGDLRLDYLEPVVQHYNLTIQKGTLSMDGAIEVAPQKQVVELREATIRDAEIDYLHRGEDESAGERAAKKVVAVATKPGAQPETVVRVDRLRLVDSRVGFANRVADPPYRLFVSDLDVTVQKFSNQPNEGRGKATLTGKFMDSGAAAIDASFQPAAASDFDLDVRIENVDLRSMNDLLRASGNFDVTSGTLSFYSELAVKNGRVDGYVKPLFADLDVYDSEQEAGESVGQKVYEGLVGGVSKLLENRAREEVATKTDISGPIEGPQTSTWQIVINLVQNAFFKSILPGLDQKRHARR